MDQSTLKELVEYSPETGIFRYKQRSIEWFSTERSCMLWNSKCAGKINGAVQSKGNGYQRVRITLNGKLYFAHRMAWLYMTGQQPPPQIDHIDRDGTNNRWSSLRDGTKVNQRNKSMQRNNKSGVTGVSWSKAANKWTARVWCLVDGKRCYKHLGLFVDKNEAQKAVTEFRSKNLYDPDHGLKKAIYI